MRANPFAKKLATLGTFAIAGIMAATLMMPVPAHAETAAELQALASATLDKLQALQDKLEDASAEYNDAVAAQEEAQKKIEEATGQITDLQGKLSTRARGMYRSGALSMLDVLTSSATLRDFATNWDLLNNMNESDAEMVSQIKDLREEEKNQEKIAADKAEVAQQSQAEAQSLVDEAQNTYNALSAEAAAALEMERMARAAESMAILGNGGNGGTGGGSYGGASSSWGNRYSGGGYTGSYSYVAGDAVKNAYAMLGQPYVRAGAAPGGFDCSGLVGWCISGGRQGSDAYYGAWPTVSASEAQPGDVCWRNGHVGIYVGNGQMIHASDYGVGVIQSPVEPGMTYHRG